METPESLGDGFIVHPTIVALATHCIFKARREGLAGAMFYPSAKPDAPRARGLFQSQQMSISRRLLSRACIAAYSDSTVTTRMRVRLMSEDPNSPASEYEIMRERLGQGALLHALRADPPAGLRVRSDAELEASLRAALDGHEPGQDLHV